MKIKNTEKTLQVKRHASLTNRIAMDFAILLLVTGLFLVCAFLGIRMRSLAEVPKETAEELAKNPAALNGKKAVEPKAKKAAEPDLILKAVGEKLRDKLGTKITVQKTGSKKVHFQK